ncbi:MAG: LysR substrate-binding domain-containing protein [Pseudorhodoplanes sp.]
MLNSLYLAPFLAVADTRHFGRAAKKLGMAQPALSLQIQKLEAELGVKLFNRHKRAPVTLTKAGEIFFKEAFAAQRQIEKADRVGRLAARGEAGEIRLGYVTTAALSQWLPTVLKYYRQNHSQVRLSIYPMTTPDQLNAISNYTLDVGILRPRDSYPNGLRAEIVHREDLMIVMACDHPLANQKKIAAADLSAETFIVPQNEIGGFTLYGDKLAAQGGFKIDSYHRAGDFLTSISMASAGYGIALVPRSVSAIKSNGIVFRSVFDFQEKAELAVVWRQSEQSLSTKHLVKEIRALKHLEDSPT